VTIQFDVWIAAEVTSLPPDTPRALSEVLESAADLLSAAASDAWLVNLELVSTQRIAELHRDYFGDASLTDVVTFPSSDDQPWVEPAAETSSPGMCPVAVAHLGDIAICVEVAIEQAQEAGHSPTRELAFLALHGTLHLLGYDDATDDDRALMLTLQEDILAAIEGEKGPL
jgi:probable rRNA maturation factor